MLRSMQALRIASCTSSSEMVVRVVKELLKQLLIIVGNSLNEVLAPFVRFVHHIGRDVDFVKGHALCLHVPYDTASCG